MCSSITLMHAFMRSSITLMHAFMCPSITLMHTLNVHVCASTCVCGACIHHRHAVHSGHHTSSQCQLPKHTCISLVFLHARHACMHALYMHIMRVCIHAYTHCMHITCICVTYILHVDMNNTFFMCICPIIDTLMHLHMHMHES
jgi:hypothetical protein